MADNQQQAGDQLQYILSDFNTRLKDTEERNRAIRERVLLLGKNLISSKEDIAEELEKLKKETRETKKDLKELKSISKSILEETNSFVRRDEIILIERMLKDFQPLEFIREKDIEEILNKRQAKKQLKTIKTIK